MKRFAILAVAGLTLASAVAYAHMPEQNAGQHAPAQQGSHGIGPGMMHGGMMHSGMMQAHGMSGAHHGDSPAGHSASARPKGDSGPSSLAFHGINAKMHSAMDIAFTGNADADFVKGMIPHHEGAVDMAKTVLAFGKDPEIRKLAEAIVQAQQSEIALMKAWLEKNTR
jgi:uncharacterized protein (DUF305 family)